MFKKSLLIMALSLGNLCFSEFTGESNQQEDTVINDDLTAEEIALFTNNLHQWHASCSFARFSFAQQELYRRGLLVDEADRIDASKIALEEFARRVAYGVKTKRAIQLERDPLEYSDIFDNFDYWSELIFGNSYGVLPQAQKDRIAKKMEEFVTLTPHFSEELEKCLKSKNDCAKAEKYIDIVVKTVGKRLGAQESATNSVEADGQA